MKMKIIMYIVFALLIGACGFPADRILNDNVKADRIMLIKSERKLLLLTNGHVLKTYKVALGRNPIGPKIKAGDGKTPEGLYIIDRHNPNSSFHLSLHISYPSDADRNRAYRAGASPGGDIMIHGLKNGLGWIGPLHRLVDWTQGCIAVTDKEIDEIAALVPDGTPIEIQK
jgi:murein L,D-transpeptidase YafK